jgi:uncharacterized protein YukE
MLVIALVWHRDGAEAFSAKEDPSKQHVVKLIKYNTNLCCSLANAVSTIALAKLIWSASALAAAFHARANAAFARLQDSSHAGMLSLCKWDTS